jgi:hypothetical protein
VEGRWLRRVLPPSCDAAKEIRRANLNPFAVASQRISYLEEFPHNSTSQSERVVRKNSPRRKCGEAAKPVADAAEPLIFPFLSPPASNKSAGKIALFQHIA